MKIYMIHFLSNQKSSSIIIFGNLPPKMLSYIILSFITLYHIIFYYLLYLMSSYLLLFHTILSFIISYHPNVSYLYVFTFIMKKVKNVKFWNFSIFLFYFFIFKIKQYKKLKTPPFELQIIFWRLILFFDTKVQNSLNYFTKTAQNITNS